MNNGNSFLRTLKRIGYPEADIIDESEFEWMFTQKELIPFLDVFCNLTENNVLTAEEIEEYSALTSDELEELEILSKSGQIDNNSEIEQKKEVFFVQEHLLSLENHEKSLKSQIELFKAHEQELIQDNESRQRILLDMKKKFQACELKILHAENEYISGLKSVLDAVGDLETLFVHSDASSSRLPSSNMFKNSVKQYVEAEEKTLQCVKIFLQNNFILHEENNALSCIQSENLQNEEFQKEAAFLQKTLPKMMMNKVISESELKKTEVALKCLENIETSFDFNCHPLQLKNKLDIALKNNEELKKREEELKNDVSDAINKYVSAHIVEVAMKCTEETLKFIQYCTDTVSLPMNTLLYQRARLEALALLLCKHTEELQTLKQLIEEAFNQIKQEQECLQKRKVQAEKEVNIVLKKNELCYETSIYKSLYKILTKSDDSAEDLSSVPLQYLLQETIKFLEVKENIKRKEEEKLKTLELLEEQASSMERLLKCTDREYSQWHELEQAMNINLNNLDVKLTALERNIAEYNQELDEKQKLLDKKGNLRLARKLYVYALLNKELFKKYIDDIKIAIENSVFKPD